MDIKTMTIEDLEARKLEISAESDNEGADMSALLEEIRNINAELESRKAELEARKAEEAQKAELRKLVAEGAGQPIKEIKEDNHKMTINEVRAMPEYIEAFANYIKTEDDKECRALLTVNADDIGVTGTVPVPIYIEERIRTNWEKLGLLSLIRKAYVRGNMGVAYEKSASPATIHLEGTDAPEEEELVIGTVTLIPQYIKKWVRVSDMTLEIGMGGAEAFLDYIYDELTYQIAKFAEMYILDAVIQSPTQTEVDPTAPTVTALEDDGTDILSIVAEAVSNLSDEAANPVIVMNKLTYAAFKSAQLAANYAVDPFDGLPVFFNSFLDTLDGDGTAPWLIVGDFSRGILGNFPAGLDIKVTRDDYTYAPQNLVAFIGKLLMAIGVVADKCFTFVTLPAGGGGDDTPGD